MATTLEEVIKQTGGCGRYQLTLLASVNFCKTIMQFTLLFMMFGAYVPDWWCTDELPDINTTSSEFTTNTSGYKSCSTRNGTMACRNFVFDTSTRTIVSEWVLICDKTWIVSTITSLQMAGLFVGNTVGGHAADAVGRKPTFYGSILAMVLLNFVAIFSTSWVMFTVVRFFLGVALGFQITVQYTIQCEFMLPKWRSWNIAFPSWEIILLFYTLCGWLLHDWRHLHILTIAFGVASFATCCFVQESFRWKVAHDRTDDAFKIVNFMAKVNKMPKPDKQELEDIAEHIQIEEKNLKERQYSIIDIIRTRKLLKCTAPLMMIWFSAGFSLYGIQFALHVLPGNFYVNIVIYNILSGAGIVCISYVLNRFGRKRTFTVLMTLFVVTAAAVGVTYRFEASPTRDILGRLCALISLTCTSTAFVVMQIVTMEIYPTVVRNIGYGMQNTMARFGAAISPQLVLLETVMPGLMYFVIAFVGILSTLSMRPLPETNSIDLQDRLSEIKVQREKIRTGLNRSSESPKLLGTSKYIDARGSKVVDTLTLTVYGSGGLNDSTALPLNDIQWETTIVSVDRRKSLEGGKLASICKQLESRSDAA